MFIDTAKIIIKSGKGGDGAVSFRREPFVPAGGPNGGNGGKGGDVVFVADNNLHTLMDLKFMRKYKAEPGENGKSSNKFGKGGDDLIVKVPVGSVIIDEASGAFMADLNENGISFIAAKGGKGGLGNSNFKNSVRQAPNFAEAGSSGQERTVIIELKLIADVGLIGLPNVGKSTFLSVTTGAKPKIANYHFTTIHPNLGVVDLSYTSFVLADIPGLIEGAAEGVGLGHDFLKHIERTKMLIHIVDISGSEGRRPIDDFMTVQNEMSTYSELIMDKPQIVVLNKTDIADEADEGYVEFVNYLEENDIKYFKISAATKQGVGDVLNAAAAILAEIERERAENEEATPTYANQEQWMKVTSIEDDPDYRTIHIAQEGDVFILTGKQLEKIYRSTNFNDPGSIGYLDKYLKTNKIINKLKARGLEDGGTIRIIDFDMEYFDDEE